MTSAMDRTGPHEAADPAAGSAGPVEEQPVAAAPAREVPAEPVVRDRAPAKLRLPKVRVARMFLVGLLTMLVGAWAGIVPFVGPAFGFSVDGTGSWTWNQAHALLNLAPGAAAVFAGLIMILAVPELAYGRRRPMMAFAGLLAMVSGAWLVIGPFTWPVIYGHGYFAVNTAWGVMLRQIGYSLGTGLVITALGAYCLGWSSHNGSSIVRRHRELAETAPPAEEPSTVATPA